MVACRGGRVQRLANDADVDAAVQGTKRCDGSGCEARDNSD